MRSLYRVGHKSETTIPWLYLVPKLNQFSKKIAQKFLRKFAVKSLLQIAPHLAYFATLPCEPLLSSE